MLTGWRFYLKYFVNIKTHLIFVPPNGKIVLWGCLVLTASRKGK